MKKRTIFLMVLMLLVSLFVINAHSVEANEVNPAIHSTDGSTIVSTADGGVVHVKDLKHADEIDIRYSEGIQTSADTVIHIKGHVTEIYRSRLVVYAGDEVLYDDQGYFFAEDKSESQVKLRLQDNYFTYHGNLGLDLSGKTITRIKFQIYTTNKTEERIGVFHLLGIHFDTNPSYDGFASLGGESVGPEQPTPEPEQPSSGYVFSASGATAEGNKYTMTATRLYLVTEVSGVDVTSTYVSVKFRAENIENFDIVAYGKAADGSDVHNDVAAGILYGEHSNWNIHEHTVYDEYVISTSYIHSLLTGFAELTKLEIKVRGAEGSVFELLDFAVTSDGVHGFEVPGQDEEPDTPVAGLVVKSASSSTVVENNVATVSGTSGAIKIEVSDVDLSAVHLALQYKAVGVTGIETVVYGNGDEAAWPAVIMPKGWNVTETIVGDMVIATVDITSAVASFTGLTTVRFNITCEENATLEVLNFAITTDGNHGFETPEEPEVPATGVFNAVSGATGTDNSFTMTSSRAEIRTPLSITDLSSLFFSVKFAQTGLEAFDVRLSGKNSAGEAIVDEAIVYKLMMDPTLDAPWTVNAYDVYGSFAVATFNPGNYLTAKDFVVVDSITFYLRGASGVTFEILDFVVTADGNHGFELPNILEFAVSDKTVDYTGSAVELEVVCEQQVEFTFEYAVKAETLEWLTGTPTDAGEYLVRVTYAGNEYISEPVVVTVVINKIASAVTKGDVVVDPHTRIITVKEGIEASLDEEFIEGEEVYSGEEVPYGAVIYYRHAADKNHLASEALQVTVKRPTWSNPVVTKKPTCIEAGSQTSSCTSCGDCGQTKVEEIPALGHTEVVDAAVAATCTEAGKTEGKHCSVCKEVLVAQTEVAALGHTEEVVAGKAATCTETGLSEGKKCSVCNEVLVAQESVAAKGHTEVVDAAVAPTCTETGLSEGKHCSVCNAVLVAQESVAVKGHTEVVDAAVAPTCTEAGKTEGKHCSVCNEVLVAQESVAAKGHTEVVDAAVAPTCTEAGKTEGKHCSECNEVLVAQEEVAALGHSYDDEYDANCNTCDEAREVPTKGCGGSILASIFGLLTLAGATIVLRKKREE